MKIIECNNSNRPTWTTRTRRTTRTTGKVYLCHNMLLSLFHREYVKDALEM